MNINDIAVQSRKGTNCMKWDTLTTKFVSDDLLPMWVADMDFRAPECVGEAIKKAADQNIYGYFVPPKSYKESFIQWEKNYHGFELDRRWIDFCPGIVTGIFWLVQIFTQPGDSCAILTPSYYPFMEAVQHTGRNLVCSELVEQEGKYHIDFADFEDKIASNNVKMFILCSPHNPVSRVWREEELRHMLEICRKYNVLVVSDEIHHDFVVDGITHIPTLSFEEYRDMVIMVTAPSKTFNMAACKNSFMIIPDEGLRDRYREFRRLYRINGGSMFGYIAAEAAYTGGREWLDTIWTQIQDNYCYIKTELSKVMPGLVFTPLEATYLMWIDMGACIGAEELSSFIQEECGLAVDFGSWFFPEEDRKDTHIRINLATSHENVETMVHNVITAWERRK